MGCPEVRNRCATYSYDNDGNLRSVLNGTASLWLVYGNLNRLTTRSLVVSGDSTNYSVSHAYDLAGNLLNLTYPDGQGTLIYAYDAFYRATSMTFGGSTIASFTYRKDDLLSSVSYGDGTLATYVFNGRGFPLEDKVTAGSTTLMDLVYAENAAGDVTPIRDRAATGDTETYGYDKQDRLLSAVGPWGTIAYGYDKAGNRVNMSLAGTWTYYAYGAYNKLCASSSTSVSCASTGGSVTKYTYDADGNIVNRVTGSTNASYTFDLDNRLVKVCTGSPCAAGNTYTFAYDGLGDRIQETGPSSGQTYTNTYVASGGEMLYLKNVVGSTTTKTAYLYAGSMLVATVSGSTKSYFHGDHLGDTRLVTQKPHSSVVVVFSTNYEPFGVPYASSGSDPSVKYTGQWSEAVGLYWNHARYYDPTLGRFVSADPALGHLSTPQTLDRYAYAVNNPMRFSDPSGRDLRGSITGFFGGLLRSGFSEAVGTIEGMVAYSAWWTGASWPQQGAAALSFFVNMGIGIGAGALQIGSWICGAVGQAGCANDLAAHAAAGIHWGEADAYNYFSGVLGAAPSPRGAQINAGMAAFAQFVGPIVLVIGTGAITDVPDVADVPDLAEFTADDPFVTELPANLEDGTQIPFSRVPQIARQWVGEDSEFGSTPSLRWTGIDEQQGLLTQARLGYGNVRGFGQTIRLVLEQYDMATGLRLIGIHIAVYLG